MSVLRIVVRGTGAEAFILAAYLARWAQGDRAAIFVDASPETGQERALLLRPSFHRFHAEIGLSAAALDRISGVAVPVTQAADDIALPFEPLGLVRNGVEFHHHWMRARTLGEQSDLAAYSPSFALARHMPVISCQHADRMPFQTGVRVDAARYAELLQQRFVALGGKVGVSAAGPDLIFDCSAEYRVSKWKGGVIEVARRTYIDGMTSHTCLEAGRRWLALAAKPGTSSAEEREFNRLGLAEADRIADMEDLLENADPVASTRPALARKIAVFGACGRIPTEDYEVFAPPEWLAALLAKGIMPARYDRLADILPERELFDWLAALRRKLAPQGMTA